MRTRRGWWRRPGWRSDNSVGTLEALRQVVDEYEAVNKGLDITGLRCGLDLAHGGPDRIGSIETGKLADLAVLDRDYFSVPDAEIRKIRSMVTIVGGNVPHASPDFSRAP